MPKLKNSRPPGTRRAFLQSLPAAPVAAAALSAPPMEAADSPYAAQVNALAEVVRLKYGTFLKEGDMDDIKRGIERNLRYAEAIAKVKITNSDEPDFMFHPFGGI